jgi:tyrosyl-tRNA synthetase
MSKSTGNYVGVDGPPEDKYGKTMSIPDSAMRNWSELLTRWTPDQIDDMLEAVEQGEVHPMEAKKQLAWEIVSIFDGDEAADEAAMHFKRVHQKRQLPEDMPTYPLAEPESVVDIITAADMARSKSQARRLVQQGAVRTDGEKITDIGTNIDVDAGEEVVLQVGKRRFIRVIGTPK